MPINDLNGQPLLEAARVNDMRAAWDAYNGRFSQPIHNRPRRNTDAVILNRCGPIVDKGVSFLFGRNVDFQLGENAEDGAQAALDNAWKSNRKMMLLHKMGINGGVTGHTFVKLLQADPYPRMIALDTTLMQVEHAPDDIERVNAYCFHFTDAAASEASGGKPVEYRQRIERVGDTDSWQILEQQRVAGVWTTTDTTDWPYPFAPIRQCQNMPAPNQFWGKADLTPDLIQLNKDINFVASNINRIIKYHAHPKTWVTGMGGNTISVAPDETLVLPEGAAMGSLEMTSDLSSSSSFMHDLMTGMEVGARIPSISLGDLEQVPTGAISGIAIELLYGPAVEKTESKRELYGELLEDLCRCLLAMMGFDPNVDISIIWPDMLPTDKLAAAQAAVIYQGLGISKETLFDRLGFSYKDEQVRLVAEARDAQVLATTLQLAPTDTLDTETDTDDLGDAGEPETDDTAFNATIMSTNG